jgi:hypothetical protein
MAHWNYAMDSSSQGGGIVSVAFVRPDVYVRRKITTNFDVWTICPHSGPWPSTTNSTETNERYISIFHEKCSTRYVSEAPEWIC